MSFLRSSFQLTAFTVLAALLGAGTLRADGEACFADRTERRIEACSAVIGTPGIEAGRLSLAYAMRALAYSLRGDYVTSIQDYDAAIRINPNFPVALNNRAWAYFKMGRPAVALPDAESSILLDPRSAHSYDTRAHIHQWLGRPGTAILDYDRAMYFGGERMIKLYQCGLQNHGLYNGPINGQPSLELRRAIAVCVESTDCDPLPPDEECRAATS